mgnify:CR=1 FL=1
MMPATVLTSAPKFITNEAGEPVEAVLSMADYTLLLEMLGDANLSRLLRERREEPARPLAMFLAEVDSEGEGA